MISTVRAVVSIDQCDQNGHMNTQYYTFFFDQATGILFHELGAPPLRTGDKLGWADIIQHTEYKAELRVGSVIRIESAVIEVGRSSLAYRHEMRDLSEGRLAATMDGRLVRFDTQKRAATPLEPDFAIAARSLAEKVDSFGTVRENAPE